MDPDLDPQKVETRYIRGKKISSGVFNFFKTIFNLFFFSNVINLSEIIRGVVNDDDDDTTSSLSYSRWRGPILTRKW